MSLPWPSIITIHYHHHPLSTSIVITIHCHPLLSFSHCMSLLTIVIHCHYCESLLCVHWYCQHTDTIVTIYSQDPLSVIQGMFSDCHQHIVRHYSCTNWYCYHPFSPAMSPYLYHCHHTLSLPSFVTILCQHPWYWYHHSIVITQMLPPILPSIVTTTYCHNHTLSYLIYHSQRQIPQLSWHINCHRYCYTLYSLSQHPFCHY